MLAINHTRKRTEKENFPVSDSRVLASSHLHSFLGWSQEIAHVDGDSYKQHTHTTNDI